MIRNYRLVPDEDIGEDIPAPVFTVDQSRYLIDDNYRQMLTNNNAITLRAYYDEVTRRRLMPREDELGS